MTAEQSFTRLSPGDPAPWFAQRSFANPRFVFDTAAGRYLVLCFFGSAAHVESRAAIQAALQLPEFFNDSLGSFFGVSAEPTDETAGRVTNRYPGYRFLWDFDGGVSRLYGSMPLQSGESSPSRTFRQQWVVLDPSLRVMKVIPFGDNHVETTMTYLRSLPPPALHRGFEMTAPVLALPNVFDSAFCRNLIDLYEANGGEESGFMREVNGKTVEVTDPIHKRRRDYTIADPAVVQATRILIHRRVVPEIAKVHQFHATRMERHIVSCYAAEDDAHFRAHRDNTTKGTAHRRFAVSINLNDEFDGGELSFPEYGPRTYKAPVGAAIVFSCSLLHGVSRVTRGRRYAFLPFLYDDAAAKIREKNIAYVDGDLQSYRA